MIFVETPIFTKEILTLLSDEDYRAIQLALLFRPESGEIIQRTGGLRKLRWNFLALASGAVFVLSTIGTSRTMSFTCSRCISRAGRKISPLASASCLEALTKLFEVLPTDENTSDVEKGFMEITSSLPADSKPTELVQPCQRSFHHPPIDAQAAAVGLPSPSQHRADAPLTQGAPMGLRIIGPIPLHPIRPTTRAADPTGHRGYAIHQRQQLRHIMPMGPRHPRRQRHPLGIGDYMVFATEFAAVRRIGTGVRPPPTARTEALSTTARDQSIRSAALSRFNRI